jgi:hypothetical protein
MTASSDRRGVPSSATLSHEANRTQLFGSGSTQPQPQQLQQQQQQQQQRQPQRQQVQQQQEELILQQQIDLEGYLAAQRAASEAVLIGRETLESAVRQGEQLQNAERVAEETEYKLDRATRLLRNMTWSGWLANKLTRETLEPPEYKVASFQEPPRQQQQLGPPMVYEHTPPICLAAAQAVQNYHCNLVVLESCDTEEQKDTCIVICNNMYNQATREVGVLQQQQQLQGSAETVSFVQQLVADVKALRIRQLKSQHLKRGIDSGGSSPVRNDKTPIASELFQGATTTTTSTPSHPKSSTPTSTPNKTTATSPLPTTATAASSLSLDRVSKIQEDHLDNMAYHLGALNQLASNISHSLEGQNDTLESLDDKSESMLFKSRMNTRRADRLIQKTVRTNVVERKCVFQTNTGR